MYRENQLYSVAQVQCLRSWVKPPLGIEAEFSPALLFLQSRTLLCLPPNTSTCLPFWLLRLLRTIYLPILGFLRPGETDPTREPDGHDREGQGRRGGAVE